MSVTIDSFGLMIEFMELFDTARDYALQFTITHTHTHTILLIVTSSLAVTR
jgi:hypothetical protein